MTSLFLVLVLDVLVLCIANAPMWHRHFGSSTGTMSCFSCLAGLLGPYQAGSRGDHGSNGIHQIRGIHVAHSFGSFLGSMEGDMVGSHCDPIALARLAACSKMLHANICHGELVKRRAEDWAITSQCDQLEHLGFSFAMRELLGRWCFKLLLSCAGKPLV